MFGDDASPLIRVPVVAAGSDRHDIGQSRELPRIALHYLSVVTDNVKMTNEVLDDVEAGKLARRSYMETSSNGGVAGYLFRCCSADVKSQYEDCQEDSDGSFCIRKLSAGPGNVIKGSAHR